MDYQINNEIVLDEAGFEDFNPVNIEKACHEVVDKLTEDPIKRNFFDDYSKKNNGKKHLLDKPKTIETKNFKIDL